MCFLEPDRLPTGSGDSWSVLCEVEVLAEGVVSTVLVGWLIVARKKRRAFVPASPPRFADGAAVRVKAGVLDPDFPDIPLGGWTGVISDIDQGSRPPMYEVTWNDETLNRVHPTYSRRCERDGLDADTTWLREADLEPDPGGVPVLEQPTQLLPRPLDPQDPDEVTLAVFGLTSDDEAPQVNEENTRRFHQYLAERLRFPFPALYIPQMGGWGRPKIDPVIVERLLPIEQADSSDGLLTEVSLDNRRRVVPLAHIQVPPGQRYAPELQAYLLWHAEATNEPGSIPSPRGIALRILLVGATLGMIVGALLETVDAARAAGQGGAILLALVGALVGATLERLFRGDMGFPPGKAGGAFFGLFGGAAVGMAVGALVVAYVGTIPGAIAGTILAKVRARFTRRRPRTFLFTVAGAAVGAMVYAFYLDPSKAGSGAGWGALIGAGGTVLFLGGAWVYLVAVMPFGKTK